MILQKLLRFFTGTAIFEFFNTPLSTVAGYIPCYKNHFEWDTIFFVANFDDSLPEPFNRFTIFWVSILYDAYY